MESGTSNNPINVPDSPGLPTPTTVRCFQCQSLDHIRPHCPEYICPSAERPPQDTLSTPALCAPAQFVESSVMWAPVAQPQPWLAHPLTLPNWATLEDFEPVSQDYNGGNVMVEEAPTSLSPFSLINCTLLSHFSSNDFIAVAFLDLARDLDILI